MLFPAGESKSLGAALVRYTELHEGCQNLRFGFNVYLIYSFTPYSACR